MFWILSDSSNKPLSPHSLPDECVYLHDFVYEPCNGTAGSRTARMLHLGRVCVRSCPDTDCWACCHSRDSRTDLRLGLHSHRASSCSTSARPVQYKAQWANRLRSRHVCLTSKKQCQQGLRLHVSLYPGLSSVRSTHVQQLLKTESLHQSG